MTLNDQLQELFEDFDSNHPAFDRIEAFEASLDNDLRRFIAHKLHHWYRNGALLESLPPDQVAYTATMIGILLGTEFAKRGYTMEVAT